ncbi:MAG: histidinol-phosphate phosphatase [Promethearchaeota archaeon CR_4]|nr:MAG: histidinol-phosphate phosphatase [Candidatus Lokiarchaeota archaeon CR_4]
MHKWDQGNNDAVFEEYWRNIHAAIKSGLFDIIGHLDLPKKFAKTPKHPDKIAPLVDEAIELLASLKIATEFNTAGWYKPVQEQYPSMDILRKLARAGVGIVIGSDAHHPDLVGRDFIRALSLLKEAGFDELCEFSKRKCVRIPLNNHEK